MKLWQIALVSVAAGITLPAMAQMGMGASTRAEVEAKVKERLGKFDANKDGTVSRDEMKAYADARAKTRADERFAAMDTNKDGSISRAEYDAAGAKVMGDRMVRVERHGGPHGGLEGAMAPVPPMPPMVDGVKIRERVRVMMGDHGGMMMMHDGDGKGIVIADAVKKALERFDATDANKDGTISAEERKAAREAWRAKMAPKA